MLPKSYWGCRFRKASEEITGTEARSIGAELGAWLVEWTMPATAATTGEAAGAAGASPATAATTGAAAWAGATNRVVPLCSLV